MFAFNMHYFLFALMPSLHGYLNFREIANVVRNCVNRNLPQVLLAITIQSLLYMNVGGPKLSSEVLAEDGPFVVEKISFEQRTILENSNSQALLSASSWWLFFIFFGLSQFITISVDM